jgi:hypothetical protein
MANPSTIVSAVAEKEAGTVHTSKFKVTAYGVQRLRKENVDIKSDRIA